MISSMSPIWAFLAVTVPLVMTPGASTAVVLRNSLSRGTLAGLNTAVGANLGSVCYGLLCAFGFMLVLRRWPTAWFMLRIGGFAYLAWLAVQSFRRARTSAPSQFSGAASQPDDRSGFSFREFREGFITNVSNPALATFYFIVLPEFLPESGSIVGAALTLTGVHVTLAATWHTLWAMAGGTLAPVLSSGRPRQALEFASGSALAYLAVRLLV
jgi:threonine/homoserine/homoserine lactone efflux protein